MKFKTAIIFFALSSALFISGCAQKIKPTDICKYKISTSDLSQSGAFDYIDFYDFAIEVSKENNFQPPMKYDKEHGSLVFGDEEVDTMPGLKMIVFMWLDNQHSESAENVCMNYQIIEIDGEPVTEGIADGAIFKFKKELEQKYTERLTEMRRIYDKYQQN